MDYLLKLNSQTAGRDKLVRFLQYLSRFLGHRLQLRGSKDVDRLRSLEYNFSTFRKLLRFGRCVDTLYSVLPIVNHPDPAIRLIVSSSKISNSLFLLADHMLWLSRSGVCEVDSDKWSNISNKYWLYSITMNLVRDFYEIYQILQREQGRCTPQNCRNPKELFLSLNHAFKCVKPHRDVVIDTVKNSCDLFIPLTALGYTKFSPSTIGILGVISSLAGILTLLDNRNKLSPA